MPILTLKFKENIIKKYQLGKGKSLTIGRGESNNLVIENLAVSGHHAKIDSVDDGFLLTDLKSKNGSFVNRKLVSSHWLKHGDIINIGKHMLVFAYKKGEPRPDESDGEMDHTMVMDTEKFKEMLAESVSEMPPGTLNQEQAGVLSYLSGGEGEIRLTKKLTKIGKNASSDIVVGGFMMGQTACTISKRPSGYFLSFVSGRSKPKINGKSVAEAVQLKEFDTIEIGSIKLQFIMEK